MELVRVDSPDAPPIRVEEGPLVLGRAPARGVVVDDPTVSREHARIFRSGDGYEVADLRSRNGTFVNGRRITRAPLRPGDELRLGRVRFRIDFEADSVEEIRLEEGDAPEPPPPVTETGTRIDAPPAPRPPPPRPHRRPAPVSARPLPRRSDRSGTLLTEDLAQRSLATRLLALALALALAYGLFRVSLRLAEHTVPPGEIPGAVAVDGEGDAGTGD